MAATAAGRPAPTTSISRRSPARSAQRKAAAILATGAELVVSGNIGCLTQIRTHLATIGADIPVMHTVEILDRAFGRERASAQKAPHPYPSPKERGFHFFHALPGSAYEGLALGGLAFGRLGLQLKM